MPTTPRRVRISPLPPANAHNPDGEDCKLLFVQNRQQSPLLSLPPELRQLIYEHVFPTDSLIQVDYQPHKFSRKIVDGGQVKSEHVVKGGFHCWTYPPPHAAPSGLPGLSGSPEHLQATYLSSDRVGGYTLLSGTCRQLHSETATFPMARASWAFASKAVMNRFVKEKRFSPAQRKAFRMLVVDNWEIPSVNAVRHFTGVREVRTMLARDGGWCVLAFVLDAGTRRWVDG